MDSELSFLDRVYRYDGDFDIIKQELYIKDYPAVVEEYFTPSTEVGDRMNQDCFSILIYDDWI